MKVENDERTITVVDEEEKVTWILRMDGNSTKIVNFSAWHSKLNGPAAVVTYSRESLERLFQWIDEQGFEFLRK